MAEYVVQDAGGEKLSTLLPKYEEFLQTVESVKSSCHHDVLIRPMLVLLF